MLLLLTMVALSGAPSAARDVTVVSEEPPIVLACPVPYCAPDARFRSDGTGALEVPTRGFTTRVLTLDLAMPLAIAYEREQERLGRSFVLSYQAMKPGAFAVLSGTSLDRRRIVYEKLVRGPQGLVGLAAEYDVARKAELDPVVASLMSSFKDPPDLRVTQKQAFERVLALPEVVALAKKLGDLPVSARLESEADPRARPGSEEARFRVAVGESHPDHVVTLYRFDVDGFSGEVLGYELLCEYALPLEVWRRLEQRIRKDGDAHWACEEFRPLAR